MSNVGVTQGLRLHPVKVCVSSECFLPHWGSVWVLQFQNSPKHINKFIGCAQLSHLRFKVFKV